MKRKTTQQGLLFKTALISGFIIFGVISSRLLTQCVTDSSDITSFSTGGHTVYHLKPATVENNNKRAVISAAYDGYVLCHNVKGELIWKNKPGDGFPFDLDVADIDNDGLDESMISSSDGNLYVLDHNGEPLWSFRGDPPLWQVECARMNDGKVIILTGGIERVLYALSSDGKIISRYETEGVIRLIGAGNILGEGDHYAVVANSRSILSGQNNIQLFRLPDLKPVWEISNNMSSMHSMEISDINKDGKEEIIFSSRDRLNIFDYQGKLTQTNTCEAPRRPYLMDFLTHIKSPEIQDEFLLKLSGKNLIVYGIDGTCRNVLPAPNAFAGSAFDPVTNTYWLGSSISGGDGIYGVRLDKPDWQDAFKNIEPVGKIKQLEENLALLLKQAEEFVPPSYQKTPGKTMIVIGEKVEWDYDQTMQHIRSRYIDPYNMKNISFVPFVYSHESIHHFKEYYDPGITDPRFRSQWEGFHSGKGYGAKGGKIWPKEDILKFAAEREQADENFFIYAGHGRPYGLDFYISQATLEEMIKLAPNTLKGFNFAEIEKRDEYIARAVKTELLSFADVCYEHDMKIFIRNKNIFWNANIYLDIFKSLMSDERYRETFVPAMEETNDRCQSLSLAGRMGLWLSGRFNHILGRAVTDNAVYNWAWLWAQKKHLSHYIRPLVLQRLMGADIFHISITTDNPEEMLPFYLMIEKGIIPLPGKEDILSLSDVTVGIRSPDEDFIEHGMNGHGITLYQPDQSEFVFDRLDCYWGGAMIPDHDFENYAMNAKRRMTNFIAQSPYGNMTTIPADADLSKLPYFRKMLVTDGKFWYDDSGKQYKPSEYKPVVLKELEEAAQRLPIRVYGDVAWAAIRIDTTHIRLVLIDPGYEDPADRDTEVVFQHIKALEVKDILSNQSLEMEEDRIKVKVPLGILRVLDITHQ